MFLINVNMNFKKGYILEEDAEVIDRGTSEQIQRIIVTGFSLRILVAGERCNTTGEYFERGSKSE